MTTTPALPARLHPLVRAFLDTPGAAAQVVSRYDSPAHLLFPQVFTDNLTRLRTVLDATPVRYRICYAHKVNRSRAFVRTARHADIALDAASPQELAAATAAGFHPDRIEVTGPKGARFLRAAVAAGVTVNVDNLWELDHLAATADTPVPVLLRISGSRSGAVSRFGIPPAHTAAAVTLAAAHRDRIDLRGFAFHLDSGEIGERVRAIGDCLALIEAAYTAGLSPSVLDIGGGFRQVFTADADRFDAYVAALRESLLGRGEPMSWGGNTFGFQLDDARVRGTPVFHKYANVVPADRMLADLLAAPLAAHGGRTVAQVAAENLLELWLEPGKALVDHAGITLARVEFVKEAADGSVLVHVDLSRDTVTPADQEVMVDPLILPAAAGAPADPRGVYFAGRLCLERDLITNHKVWPRYRPQPGDLVVFPNTAAYHMDLSAAGAALYPPIPKLVALHTDTGFRICTDADYEPVTAAGSS